MFVIVIPILRKKCVDDLMEVIKNASKDHSGVMLRNKMEVMPFWNTYFKLLFYPLLTCYIK